MDWIKQYCNFLQVCFVFIAVLLTILKVLIAFILLIIELLILTFIFLFQLINFIIDTSISSTSSSSIDMAKGTDKHKGIDKDN